MTADPAALSATEALAAFRSGALGVERLAQACLDRIAARHGEVRAWAALDREGVLARARVLDAMTPGARGRAWTSPPTPGCSPTSTRRRRPAPPSTAWPPRSTPSWFPASSARRPRAWARPATWSSTACGPCCTSPA